MVGSVGSVGLVGSVGAVGVGRVSRVSRVSKVGRVGRVGRVSRVGRGGRVGRVSRVGRVGRADRAGRVGRVGKVTLLIHLQVTSYKGGRCPECGSRACSLALGGRRVPCGTSVMCHVRTCHPQADTACTVDISIAVCRRAKKEPPLV